MDWKAELGDKVLGFGSPLMPGEQLESERRSWRFEHNGYWLFSHQTRKQRSLDGIVEIAPHLQWEANCAIEVYECIQWVNSATKKLEYWPKRI